MNKVLLFMSVGLVITLNACQSSGEKVAQSGGDNPFLSEYTTPFGVPPFDKIRITDYKPAFLQGMEEEQKEIEAICNNPEAPTFENTIVAMDRAGGLLRKVSSVFYGQNSANTSDEMQAMGMILH